MTRVFRCGRFELSLARPLIMGIVNLTRDSFSGDGHATDTAGAIAHARRLIEEGADLLDVGGESTRPGAQPVSLDDERAAVLPVVDALRDAGVPISVDTMKPALMREAIAAGADMINDVRALQEEGALEAVAGSSVGVCLMHMAGTPRTMQAMPEYGDVVADVAGFLRARVDRCLEAGIGAEHLCVDPGFGFGKTTAHNLEMLRNLAQFTALRLPVLIGLSRKSLFGTLTGRKVDARAFASVTGAVLAVQRGAAIVRVHDVAGTRDALAVLAAVEQGQGSGARAAQ